MKIKISFLLIWVVIIGLSSAREYSYDVVSPLMGKLGTITVNSITTKGGYSVEAKAVTEGMAAFLTKHRRERYLSEGHSANSRYITDRFKITRKMKGKKEIDEYIFDHNSSIVLKRRLRWRDNHLKKDDTKPLKYPTDIDLTAIYLNTIPKLLDKYGVEKSFKAAGADKIGGRVIVYTPDRARAKRELKKLGLKRGNIVIVTTDGKIFGKRGRELVMAIDSDGIMQKAWLEAIPVVGTLYVKRTK